MAQVIKTTGGLTRHGTNQQRVVRRLRKLAGVVRVARSGEGLAVVLRTRREMILLDDEGEQFREDGLVYTRVRVVPVPAPSPLQHGTGVVFAPCLATTCAALELRP